MKSKFLMLIAAVALVLLFVAPATAAKSAVSGIGHMVITVQEPTCNYGPYVIPGRIEAENYMCGGEGVAYHDTTANNEGGSAAPRANEGVDTEMRTDTGNVGWTHTGEWIQYSVDVEAAGEYDVTFRVAHVQTGGSFVLKDEDTVLTSVDIPNTGDWSNFTYVTKTINFENAGEQVLTILFTGQASNGYSGNLDWMEFEPIVVDTPTIGPSSGSSRRQYNLRGAPQLDDVEYTKIDAVCGFIPYLHVEIRAPNSHLNDVGYIAEVGIDDWYTPKDDRGFIRYGQQHGFLIFNPTGKMHISTMKWLRSLNNNQPIKLSVYDDKHNLLYETSTTSNKLDAYLTCTYPSEAGKPPVVFPTCPCWLCKDLPTCTAT